MKNYPSLCILLVTLFVATAHPSYSHSDPLNILIVNGGCCHDYAQQGTVLKSILYTHLGANVVLALSPSNKTNARFEIYQKTDWAQGYDLIIHNECSADVTDRAYVKRILDAHLNGVPAINLHCAMHSYRWGNYKKAVEPGDGNASWFEMVGIQSAGHGPHHPVSVSYLDANHPITKGLESWTTPVGELNNNIRIFENTKILAMGSQSAYNDKVKDAAVLWTNLYGPLKTKIVSISIGHSSREMLTENFSDILIRSVLWATDELF
jgi:type 1 glutamine amidotransferase